MSTSDVHDMTRAEIDQLGPWFHNLHLPNGVQTAPDHWLGDFPTFKWKLIEPHIPQRLDGMTVLDVGCNAGFYSIELARRGARVTAVDVNPHYLRQAQWAARQYGVADAIQFRQMQVYDLAHIPDQFDIVWFMGVLYHLRYPMLGLDIIAEKVRRTLVFQTLTMPGEDVCTQPLEGMDIEDRDLFLHPGWPRMAFIEHTFVNDPTNWWAPNHAAVEAMLRSAGLSVIERPGHEIYLCEPAPRAAGAAARWEDPEFLAATGRSVPERQAGAA